MRKPLFGLRVLCVLASCAIMLISCSDIGAPEGTGESARADTVPVSQPSGTGPQTGAEEPGGSGDPGSGPDPITAETEAPADPFGSPAYFPGRTDVRFEIRKDETGAPEMLTIATDKETKNIRITGPDSLDCVLWIFADAEPSGDIRIYFFREEIKAETKLNYDEWYDICFMQYLISDGKVIFKEQSRAWAFKKDDRFRRYLEQGKAKAETIIMWMDQYLKSASSPDSGSIFVLDYDSSLPASENGFMSGKAIPELFDNRISAGFDWLDPRIPV
jgi:hypothetical protein